VKQAVAEETKPTAEKRAKRRVKPVETVRQQRDKQLESTQNKSRRVRRFFHWLFTPLRRIGGLKVWQATWFKPIRWVAKIVGYILFIPYLKASFEELKLVTWPNWKQSWRLTWAVLVFSVFFGVLLAVVDYGLDKLFRKIILGS
jgi:preprotein translocase SecE subunit